MAIRKLVSVDTRRKGTNPKFLYAGDVDNDHVVKAVSAGGSLVVEVGVEARRVELSCHDDFVFLICLRSQKSGPHASEQWTETHTRSRAFSVVFFVYKIITYCFSNF